MSERTLGTDTSHWSGSINFDTMYNAGARFWITKATDAFKDKPVQYEDSKFMEFTKNAFEHNKLLIGCYHWLQMSIDPVVAADYYLERYNRFPFDFPAIMDFEETYVIQTGKFSDYAWRAQMWLEHVEKKTGRLPIIYTAKWYLDYFKSEQISWMKKYPLWVADYSWVSKTLNKPYYMPKYWDKHTMWQFSADGNGRGREFGINAGDICLDWYEGSYDDLLKFLYINQTEPEPPVVIPPQEPQPPPNTEFRFRVLSQTLNIRSTPSTLNNKNVVGSRVNGEIIRPLEIKVVLPNSVWVRDSRGWSAMVHENVKWLEWVG